MSCILGMMMLEWYSKDIRDILNGKWRILNWWWQGPAADSTGVMTCRDTVWNQRRYACARQALELMDCMAWMRGGCMLVQH
jgi:hypothetical protein